MLISAWFYWTLYVSGTLIPSPWTTFTCVFTHLNPWLQHRKIIRFLRFHCFYLRFPWLFINISILKILFLIPRGSPYFYSILLFLYGYYYTVLSPNAIFSSLTISQQSYIDSLSTFQEASNGMFSPMTETMTMGIELVCVFICSWFDEWRDFSRVQ